MVTSTAGLLARGPWHPAAVTVSWLEDHYEPDAVQSAAADAAVAALRDRGSPSHDGVSGRLARFDADDERLHLVCQPTRWALRLVEEATESLAALCVTRDADGRWLAGRRAPWLASWPGRWTLGAGGAVDVGENPADTLHRELAEEWSVAPERLTVEALVRLPSLVVMLVGLARLPPGAAVERDEEHDAHAWWPPDPADWPPEADDPVRRMGKLLAAP